MGQRSRCVRPLAEVVFEFLVLLTDGFHFVVVVVVVRQRLVDFGQRQVELVGDGSGTVAAEYRVGHLQYRDAMAVRARFAAEHVQRFPQRAY